MTHQSSASRIRQFIWIGMLLFTVVIVVVASLLMWRAHRTVLAASAAQTMRYTTVAESALNRRLLELERILGSLQEILPVPEAASDTVATAALTQALRTAVRHNLLLDSVAVLDAQGAVLASSVTDVSSARWKLPPQYLERVLAAPAMALSFSAPTVRGGAVAKPVIYLARAEPGGPAPTARDAAALRRVVVAELAVQSLSALMAQLDFSHLQLTLERGDGQLLLSVPALAADQAPGSSSPTLAEMSRSAASSPLGQASAPEREGGMAAGLRWDTPARVSAEPALVVPRRLRSHDLYLGVSLPENAALQPWREQRQAIALATVLLVAMVSAVGSMSLLYLRRVVQARAEIDRSQATLAQALESMISGFILIDSTQRVVRWNRRFEEIFPWLDGVMYPLIPFVKVLEIAAAHHMAGATDAQRTEWVAQRMRRQLAQEPHEQAQPNGLIIQINERRTPEGGFVIIYHDVTALHKASAEIETLAFYDPLTNLPNRRLLMDRMQHAIQASERTGQYGALLFLDLDHFKNLNDTLGHKVGDALLARVAQRLNGTVRLEDTVARIGGDEFVVMLSELSRDHDEAAEYTRRVGEKILEQMREPYQIGNLVHRSSVSIGATLIGGVQEASVDVLKHADIAMYQVKARGRDALCFFDPEMQVAITERTELEADLQAALAAGQFVLHYQPQVHSSGKLIGAEALIRWQHPVRGLLSPGAFISVAEESELIVPIGRWALRTACHQLAQWQEDPRFSQMQVAVNVSARQFRHPDFIHHVVEALRETGARPHLLKLELTESVVLDDVDHTIAKMGEIKTKGVRFSVDDFGTGYSSLAYLTRLPIDQLKIDKSFVQHLGERPTDDVIVQTIVGMASNLELDVIAEGVETALQKEMLEGYGCHYFQGYLMGRPQPLADFEVLMARMAGATGGGRAPQY